ncbi:hypothetical protein ACIHDR_03455 [Nocardia sp. NPDC052278]|uniref:hypothetical protein n=1 Tax=unclassified Nocardia TaxID=2637762 RepID=UPI003698B539
MSDSASATSDGPKGMPPTDNLATVEARRKFGEARVAVGRPDQAIPWFEATVRDLARILGPDHDDTVAARQALENARSPAGTAWGRLAAAARVVVAGEGDGISREAIHTAWAELANSEVVRELVTIGVMRGFLTDERAAQIGSQLNDEGGMDLMRAVHAAVADEMSAMPGRSRELEAVWGGIGSWRG